MAYGPSFPHLHGRAADYVEKAGDIPVEQPAKFEFVINLKTAKALSLEVPLHLQQLADEVIE